jgi:hypothetical protein
MPKKIGDVTLLRVERAGRLIAYAAETTNKMPTATELKMIQDRQAQWACANPALRPAMNAGYSFSWLYQTSDFNQYSLYVNKSNC